MPKTMIFLFDGTANDASLTTFSNVYAINQLIADRKSIKTPTGVRIKTQVTFYLPGVGTKFTVREGGWFSSHVLKAGQYLFGDGIEQLILRAYVNLSANYHPGDEIVLLGFSRGAVAARIFSRLVSDFGILSSDMLLHLDELWKKFVEISREESDETYESRIKHLQGELANKMGKPVFLQPSGYPIKFLGVFDTVAGPLDNDVVRNIDFRDLCPAKGVEHVVHLLSMHDVRDDFHPRRFEPSDGKTKTFREIWLPGVHSDVGGGYDDNFIANVALLTMSDFLQSLGGIALDQSAYSDVQKKIRAQVRDRRFVINDEAPRMKRKRDTMIAPEDEIHPLHWYFLKEKHVIWKGETPPPSAYEDRLKRDPEIRDRKLNSRFERWVSQLEEG